MLAVADGTTANTQDACAAFAACNRFRTSGTSAGDWYLPSRGELSIYSSNYIYAYSNVDASMTFTNCTLITASSGKMDQSGEWDAESSIILDNNTTLNLEKGKTYRIRVGSVEKLPDSKKLSEDGYYSTYDSIRSA